MLKGTNDHKERYVACQKLKERSWVFKVDWWTYFKGAYSEPSSYVHLSLGFSIFSVKLMNWDLEKVSLQAYSEKW